MTIAKCTENGCNAPIFDLELCEGFDEGPYIDFALPPVCWPENYTGGGVFTVNLDVFFNDFFNEYFDFSHGEKTKDVIKQLRILADKLEQDLESRDSAQE